MTVEAAIYPADAHGRDRFVVANRGARPLHDPRRHHGVTVEDERAADGRVVRSATVFLTGRECPWRCVMCDLWRFTTIDDTPPGALVYQLESAGAQLRARGPLPEHVKLYNAGSFFDPRAVPEADYDGMAAALRGYRHVIVESHPLLVGPRLERWRRALERAAGAGTAPTLEVAVGLETAHPAALERLHKRFTLSQFEAAAARLHAHDVGLRVFLLVGIPFLDRPEQRAWVRRSVTYAFDCGASAVSLIPTRPGNGALDALAASGAFDVPTLADVEDAFDDALAIGRGRVFVDLWDLERLFDCPACAAARQARLHAMNLAGRVLPRIRCTHGVAEAQAG